MTIGLSGGILSDCITWVRRIIKAPSTQAITDAVIGDYINRFYVYEMAERIQLFELKRQYTFETIPNILQYQFPYKQYQTLRPPAYCDGVLLGYYESNEQFYNIFPEFVNNEFPVNISPITPAYQFTAGAVPILNGFRDDLGNLVPYVYITASNTFGQQQYIVDDGNGNLIQTDATFQYAPDGVSSPLNVGTINYLTGTTSVFGFMTPISAGVPIEMQTCPYSAGFPRIMLFFNNIIKLYPVPDRAYKIQIDCNITPAQFMATNSSIPFAYMTEYLARGAARKIMSDTGDTEQFQFYEPLFREQEVLVLRRTSRQNATQRTPTIFSTAQNQQPFFYTQY